MLRLARTDSELAYVVAHELGHSLAQHRREICQADLVRYHCNPLLTTFEGFAGPDTLGTSRAAMLLTLLTFAAQSITHETYWMPPFNMFAIAILFGPNYLLKRSYRGRFTKLEAEADHIGLRLMSRAGYKPRSAVKMLQSLQHTHSMNVREETHRKGDSGRWKKTDWDTKSSAGKIVPHIWTKDGWLVERPRQWLDVHLEVSDQQSVSAVSNAATDICSRLRPALESRDSRSWFITCDAARGCDLPLCIGQRSAQSSSVIELTRLQNMSRSRATRVDRYIQWLKTSQRRQRHSVSGNLGMLTKRTSSQRNV